MKAALFSNQFASRHGHGIARYAREMHAALVRTEGVDVVPVSAWTDLAAEPAARLASETGHVVLPTGRTMTKLGWTFARMPRVEWMMPEDFSVLHALSLGYPIATGKPFLVTVHDLGPLTHPKYFSNTRPTIMKWALAQAVNKAAVIVCVSQSTANEVREYCGPSVDGRVRVVGEGVSPTFFEPPAPDVLAGLDLPPEDTPFVLAAGKISPRKNIQGVLKAMRALSDLPHHLVLPGAAGWETEAVLAELGDETLRSRVHLLGFVTDEQLRALYGRAAMYVHPSLYEGFGLTVLEAMAAGVPVITANTSSLPEVAGDAAILVDPTSVDDLAAAIEEIAGDANRARELSERGLARARTMRWDDSAAELLDCYKQALAG